MRVIGGTFRGRRLRTVHGSKVRPTSDRLRETLFNILAPHLDESRFLDVCAGSGAVGIEAISRGASHVTFIEQARSACAAIEENLETLGIDTATIINRDVLSAFRRLSEQEERFDLIFFDPPYASDIYSKVMTALGTGTLLAEDAAVIVEHRVKTPPETEYGELRIYRQVRQGESALAFYARA